MSTTETTPRPKDLADAKGLVNIQIDGHWIMVPRGTRMIEACKIAEKEVPHYCYHPKLSSPGNCRMCMVQMGMPPRPAPGAAPEYGGREEKELSGRIAQAAQYPVINTTGKLTILEAGAVLKKCRLLVTNDSALLHLAEYVKTPVVAIFGPTVREFGYYPHLKESIPIEIELNCRPCSRSGTSLCPLGTKECLTSIRIGSILGAIESILGLNIDDI